MSKREIRISSCRTTSEEVTLSKPKRYSFIEAMAKNPDRKRTKEDILYTAPKIKESKGIKYIEYGYRIPPELKHIYSGVFKRFKVYENINRRKNLNYPAALRTAVQEALELGFDPFLDDLKTLKQEEQPKEWTAQQAIYYFIQKWEEKGLEKSSIAKYNRTAKRFLAWLDERNLKHQPIDILNIKHIEGYLSITKKAKGWENRSYNNELTFLNTIFTFLVKYSILNKNPCVGIDKQVTITKKHRYYDERLFSKIKSVLSESDPYLLFACQVVYYLCIRSEKELKHFKVGNIFKDRKQVLITAADSKTNQDRYIPMCDEMIRIFEERKILDYPPSYYVFSVPHKNKFVKDGEPGVQPFGNGFFSKRFSKVRKILGLNEDHTLFSFRHTRAVHLKIDGVSDAEIQMLFGHSDFHTTSRYLRNLGLSVNAENLNVKSRKF